MAAPLMVIFDRRKAGLLGESAPCLGALLGSEIGDE